MLDGNSFDESVYQRDRKLSERIKWTRWKPTNSEIQFSIEWEREGERERELQIINIIIMHPESPHFERTCISVLTHSLQLIHNKRILGKKHDGEVQTSKSFTRNLYIFQIESAKKKFEHIQLDVEQVRFSIDYRPCIVSSATF